MTFGEKVKTTRMKLIMSQKNFAKELGVSYSTVNRWETGKFEPSYKSQKLFYDYCEKNNIRFEKKNTIVNKNKRIPLKQIGYIGAKESEYYEDKMEIRFRFISDSEYNMQTNKFEKIESYSEKSVMKFMVMSYAESCLTLLNRMEKYANATSYLQKNECAFRFFPAMFCFRHYLELKLKYLYMVYANEGFNVSSHNLDSLLKEIKEKGFNSNVFDKPIAMVNEYEKSFSKDGDEAFFRFFLNKHLECGDSVEIPMFNLKKVKDYILNIEHNTSMMENNIFINTMKDTNKKEGEKNG